MKRLAAIALCLLCSSALAGASPEARQISQLREQRKFAAAEKRATELLADRTLSDEARFELSLELSRTWAEHALESPAKEQPDRWRRAQRVIDDFAASFPQHPRLALLQAQGNLAALAQSQRAREDAELGGNEPAKLKAARDALRPAIASSARLHGQVAAQLSAQAQRRDKRPTGLTLAELESLELNLRYGWACGLREQALSYPATSADRMSALSRALEVLRPMAVLELNTPLAWSARLEEIARLRLIEDTPAAEHKLVALGAAAPPAELAGRVRAERIRVALARGHLDEALAEAAPSAPRPDGDWVQTDLALLETYLALWQQAQQQSDKAAGLEWELAAGNQVGAIEQAYGDRWARQADLLLMRSISGKVETLQASTLVRVAQGYFRAGDLPQAAAVYDRAGEAARAAGKAELAFSAGLAAAAIDKEQQQFAAAIDRYAALALTAHSAAQAAEAHLLAVHCAAQLARSGEPAQLNRYGQLLEEHLAKWPQGATASQAWWWLGRLRELRGEHDAAIDALGRVKPDSPNYDEAVAAAGRVYEHWLAALRQQQQPTRAIAAKAIAYLDNIVAPGGKPPREWTPAARFAANAEARILLVQSLSDAERGEALVRSALAGEPPPTPPVERMLQTTHVAALAAADRISQATQVWEETSHAVDVEALALVETLDDLQGAATEDRRVKLALLSLKVVDDLLRSKPLEAATRLDLQRRQARLLAETGRRREALALLKALAAEQPTDGETQEALALFLAGDRSRLAEAIEKWRDISQKCRPGSPRWWRAHYGLAKAQLDAGLASDCLATIRRAEANARDFGGGEMQARFVQLQQQCAKAASAALPMQSAK